MITLEAIMSEVGWLDMVDLNRVKRHILIETPVLVVMAGVGVVDTALAGGVVPLGWSHC